MTQKWQVKEPGQKESCMFRGYGKKKKKKRGLEDQASSERKEKLKKAAETREGPKSDDGRIEAGSSTGTKTEQQRLTSRPGGKPPTKRTTQGA